MLLAKKDFSASAIAPMTLWRSNCTANCIGQAHALLGEQRLTITLPEVINEATTSVRRLLQAHWKGRLMGSSTNSDDRTLRSQFRKLRSRFVGAPREQVSRQQKEKEADNERQEALSKEYGEVCSNFRALTDIRFKLLAFLPIAAAAAVAALTGNASEQRPAGTMLALSLFGLVVTIALATYNARNDQLYDALVARATEIERSVGIPDGAFANRPGSWLSIPLVLTEWKVDHRTAVGTVYGASIALWLFGLAKSALGVLAGTPLLSLAPPPRWENLIAVAFAIAVTVWASLWVKMENCIRSDAKKCLAKKAMCKALGQPESTQSTAADGDFAAFLAGCVDESDKDHEDFIAVCGELSGFSGGSVDDVRKRARFYSRLAKDDRTRLNHYLLQGPNDLQASHLIGLLTNLSPLWIYDTYHDR
jgi:hypothetical protein